MLVFERSLTFRKGQLGPAELYRRPAEHLIAWHMIFRAIYDDIRAFGPDTKFVVQAVAANKQLTCVRL